jgi:hypothetical protein
MIKPDLSLSFRPVRAASKGRWVKAGVEFYEGKLNISIVAADLWADWNLLPLSETAIKQNEVSIEFEREQKEDGSYGMVLKAYVNRYNGGEKTMIREVTWVFHEQDEEDEMWIGVYAARPIQDEREALPYLLAYKTPLRYKTPSYIRPPQAERRCKICMAHRPSTIVNPFTIRPSLREGICLARAT